MKKIKIISKILVLEKKLKSIQNELEKSNLLKEFDVNYSLEEKKELFIFWQKYSSILLEIKKFLFKLHYRKFILFFDKDIFILKRYLLLSYYNAIGHFLFRFKNHEPFIRQYISDNFKIDIDFFTKTLYLPSHVQLFNTPELIVNTIEKNCQKEVQNFIKTHPLKKDSIETRIYIDGKNFYTFLKTNISPKIFKISKFIGTKIADIRFTPRDKGLLKEENINMYLKKAQPGDIFLTRGNWNATNISIPGFWKHMSLYLGNGKFLKKYFYEYIKNLYIEDNSHYIIEATAEGVQIKNIEGLLSYNDYLGVSRTNFTNEKIQRSIQKALSLQGTPYDFLFNFYSDKNLVCSELVLKSYSKDTKEDISIELELQEIGFGITFPPHNFMKILLKEQKKQNPKVVPIFFIDSEEKTGKNFVSTIEKFLQTIKRPRFSIFLK